MKEFLSAWAEILVYPIGVISLTIVTLLLLALVLVGIGWFIELLLRLLK